MTVTVMTRQYLIGELSAVLGELEDVTHGVSRGEVARLRHEAERVPLTALTSVTERALGLIDRLCRDSLDRGDATAFAFQSTIGAELRDFGICARLLDEAPVHAGNAGQ